MPASGRPERRLVSIPQSGFGVFGLSAPPAAGLRYPIRFNPSVGIRCVWTSREADYRADPTLVSIPQSGFGVFGPQMPASGRPERRLVSIPQSGFGVFGPQMPASGRPERRLVSIPQSGFGVFGPSPCRACNHFIPSFNPSVGIRCVWTHTGADLHRHG